MAGLVSLELHLLESQMVSLHPFWSPLSQSLLFLWNPSLGGVPNTSGLSASTRELLALSAQGPAWSCPRTCPRPVSQLGLFTACLLPPPLQLPHCTRAPAILNLLRPTPLHSVCCTPRLGAAAVPHPGARGRCPIGREAAETPGPCARV